jgi:hypothetical protein
MATAAIPSSQAAFYARFLMARKRIDPRAYGYDSGLDDFTDQMVSDFAEAYRDSWAVDELLLHPREAMRFCDDVRRRHGCFDMPDDIILRVIMGRRKNPNA